MLEWFVLFSNSSVSIQIDIAFFFRKLPSSERRARASEQKRNNKIKKERYALKRMAFSKSATSARRGGV